MGSVVMTYQLTIRKLPWRRIGKGSGPANVLANRWEVRFEHRRWWVLDHLADFSHGPYPRMADARTKAEQLYEELPS